MRFFRLGQAKRLKGEFLLPYVKTDINLDHLAFESCAIPLAIMVIVKFWRGQIGVEDYGVKAKGACGCCRCNGRGGL